MKKTPAYEEGNTRDPRNPADDDLPTLKAAGRAIKAAEAREEEDKPPNPRPS